MDGRYLFGPVTREFAEHHLQAEREAGRCRCFGDEPGLDLVIGPVECWGEVLAKLPADWRPDFVVLQMQYTTPVAAFAQCPVPVVALAGDWQWQWHAYRSVFANQCELVLSDAEGAERLGLAGIGPTRPAFLVGADPRLRVGLSERDIDILFAGNVHPAVHRERLPYLGRLACLHGRYRVHIATGVADDELRKLLARARIVFQHGADSESCWYACEAIAAGALVLREAGNRAMGRMLSEGVDYVAYTDANLETLLERYLGDEAERVRLADAAQARVGELSFATRWQDSCSKSRRTGRHSARGRLSAVHAGQSRTSPARFGTRRPVRVGSIRRCGRRWRRRPANGRAMRGF
jgi:hypothetical protein